MTFVHDIPDNRVAGAPADIPIPYRIIALMQEQARLFAYPAEELEAAIRQTGFRCACCGACCTRAVNRHVFLLDREVTGARRIDPGAVVPAPEPEFCDQHGVLYVSGYALRARADAAGSCWFLQDDRCAIYKNRFSGCRIYPYMLRRSPNESGNVVWKIFSRKNGHASSGPALSPGESSALAREVREYENTFLTQQIAFLETIHAHFSRCGLHHDPAMHRMSSHRFACGRPVGIRVFRAGELEEYTAAGERGG